MKKQTKLTKLLLTIIAAFAMTCLCNVNEVKAATATITGNQTVTSGQTVTVTATVTAGAWNLTLSGGGKSQPLVGQTSVVGNQTASASITFIANSDTTVYLTGDITDFSSDKPEQISKSTKVTVNSANANGNPKPNSTTSNNTSTNTNQTPATTTENKKSNVATLSNLGIKPNDFSGFKPNTFSYSTQVENEVESIEVYASKGQDGQKITGTGKKTLKEGANSFSVVVTAEDGKTQKTYTINVTRKEKVENSENEENDKPEEDENSDEKTTENVFGLSQLKIGELEIQPQFQTDIYEYKLELKEDIEKLDITAIATKENSNIEITGNDNLQEGENVITIIVKDENEEKVATYQVIVNKILEKNTENSEQNQKEKITKIAIISVIGVLVFVIFIAIIVKVKKSKGLEASYIPYGNLMNDYNENDKITDNQVGNVKDDELTEKKNKKKRNSKGKRYK